MERLTHRYGPDGRAVPTEFDIGPIASIHDDDIWAGFDAMVDRLAAYEDICFDAGGKERITVEELSALVKAGGEGRVVALEGITTGQANTIMGMCEQLNAMKARHGDDQEPLITWQLYNALTKSFARAEARGGAWRWRG